VSVSPTFADLVLAFRLAKRAVATERGVVGLYEWARFEMGLATNLQCLRRKLAKDRWFADVDIGALLVMPKGTHGSPAEHSDIVRVGDAPCLEAKLSVRLQLEPTPEFTITEILYLWQFGPALESTLGEHCVGYRLKRVARERKMDRHDRDIHEHWPLAFARYRDDPIKAARAALTEGKRVSVTSTDVVSFFDAIDPQFLIADGFVRNVAESSRLLGRSFSEHAYVSATKSLLEKFASFRLLRRKVGGETIDIHTGVPIGALTSRVFANVALASVDAHVARQPDVILYRRYVDDIVVVSVRDRQSPGPGSRADVVGALFPGFQKGRAADRFVVPDTGAVFELKEEKTRVHDLVGQPGVDFLEAVQKSFSAVTSEQRAFLGNVESLESDIEGVDLFSDGVAGVDRIPRLRDADRFTLRRFMATAFIRGLERCALLLDQQVASSFVEHRAKRMLSIIKCSTQIEDFELALALLKVALLCGSTKVAQELRLWLDASSKLHDHVTHVTWCGVELRSGPSRKLLARYLRRRIDEAVASVPSFSPVKTRAANVIRRNAILLRRADLRRLDREDDEQAFGVLPPLSPKVHQEHAAAARAGAADAELHQRFQVAAGFISRSNRLGETIWTGASPIGLFLSVRPPSYVDINRRFLARIETRKIEAGIGRLVDHCADALRGTRYTRREPLISLASSGDSMTLVIGDAREPATVRVMLSNLSVKHSAFLAAANGVPELTLERLRALDHVLREAQRSAGTVKRASTRCLLVLPELAVPRRWMRALTAHAVREALAIVAGVEYGATARGLVNQAMGVFPGGMHTAATVRWTKRYPAKAEEAGLGKLTPPRALAPARPSTRRLVVESAHGRIGVLICSEILEADALSSLRARIELLLVPAWNPDTPSFEHLIHSVSSLLVHAFVAVANNAEGSDTRIVAPVKEPRHERDWCRLIHRGENQIIWDDLPIAELRAIHEQRDAPTDRRKYRPLPPGWISSKHLLGSGGKASKAAGKAKGKKGQGDQGGLF
jgi:hypothetical protein